MSHERRLAHMRFMPEESSYPFVAMIPQNVTEAILVDELKRKGGRVEYESSMRRLSSRRSRTAMA
jgi:hypothetical protein